jgi:hypothetical protein
MWGSFIVCPLRFGVAIPFGDTPMPLRVIAMIVIYSKVLPISKGETPSTFDCASPITSAPSSNRRTMSV